MLLRQKALVVLVVPLLLLLLALHVGLIGCVIDALLIAFGWQITDMNRHFRKVNHWLTSRFASVSLICQTTLSILPPTSAE